VRVISDALAGKQGSAVPATPAVYMALPVLAPYQTGTERGREWPTPKKVWAQNA